MRSLLLGVMLAGCGSSATPPTTPSPTNTTTTRVEQSRNDVVKDALAALVAGDADRLLALADPKGLYEYVFSCKDDGTDSDPRSLEESLRQDFKRAIDAARGARVEIVSIKNERSGRRYRDQDRNATFVAKGGTLSSGCTAKSDVLFHEVEVRVKITRDGQTSETRARLELVHARERWFVAKLPRALGSGSSAGEAVARMEDFQKQMCNCKDKACADKVNEDMTKWGTEMARNAGANYDERPDPDLAKKSADIMTKYTECMTKLFMAAGTSP